MTVLKARDVGMEALICRWRYHDRTDHLETQPELSEIGSPAPDQ